MGSRTSTKEANGYVTNGKFHALPKPSAAALAARPLVEMPPVVINIQQQVGDLGIVTVGELAARFDVTEQTIRRGTIDENCPHGYVGGTPAFEHVSFLDWFRSRLITKSPVTVLSAPTAKQIVGADPTATV